MIKVKCTGFAFGAALLLLASSAQALLIDRGEGLIYSTELDLTFFQDTKYAETAMDLQTALDWTDNLSYGGYNDWRLPTAGDYSETLGGSELDRLAQIELGWTQPNWDYYNTDPGSFFNLSGAYWLFNPDFPHLAYYWNSFFGDDFGFDTYNLYVWVVRDGDVAQVPEPSTFLLLGAGLLGLAATRINRRKDNLFGNIAR